MTVGIPLVQSPTLSWLWGYLTPHLDSSTSSISPTSTSAVQGKVRMGNSYCQCGLAPGRICVGATPRQVNIFTKFVNSISSPSSHPAISATSSTSSTFFKFFNFFNFFVCFNFFNFFNIGNFFNFFNFLNLDVCRLENNNSPGAVWELV